MNTIIVWDSVGEEPIKFISLDGDLSRFNRVYINVARDDTLDEELNGLLYLEDGQYRHHMSEEFPFDAYVPGETRVITAGYWP